MGGQRNGSRPLFSGSSACYFEPKLNCTKHAVLNIKRLPHPPTGENIMMALKASLEEWEIPDRKIILIISEDLSMHLSPFSRCCFNLKK